MKSYAHTMFCCRSLFWLAAFFASFGLVSAQTTYTHRVVITNTGSVNFTHLHVILITGDLVNTDVSGAFGIGPAGNATIEWADVDPGWSAQVFQGYDASATLVGNSYLNGTAPESYAGVSAPFGSYDYPATVPTSATVSVALDPSTARYPTPDQNKSLWVVSGVSGDALDKGVFREGIDKVVYAVEAASSSGSGGGGGTNASGHSVEDYHALALDVSNHPDHAAGMVMAETDAAATASTAAVAGITTLLPAASSSITYAAPSGSSSFLSITMPATFGGATVHFNPFENQPGFDGSSMSGIATWFRYACQWLALALLGIFVFNEFKVYMVAMSAVRQAAGNPAIGGTGAQATALLNAGLITAAVVVALAALLAWSFNEITPATLLTNISTNPLAGMAGDAYWFLDQIFPLATLLSCFVARFMFYIAGNAIFGVFFTVVRFFIA